MSFYSKIKKSTDTNYFQTEEQAHPLSSLCFRDCTKWKINIKTSESQTVKSVSVFSNNCNNVINNRNTMSPKPYFLKIPQPRLLRNFLSLITLQIFLSHLTISWKRNS